jgi:hypothetical protein
MKRIGGFCWLATFSMVGYMTLLGLISAKALAENPSPPAPPKVSTFAPAEDLTRQANVYIQHIQDAVESEGDYKDAQEQLARDANTLIVIELALGLHDQDNDAKANAPAVMKAAQELATVAAAALKNQEKDALAKNYEAAKKAVEGVKAAADGKTKAEGELKWGKVASLEQLMKEVPVINTKLKRNVKGPRLKSKAKDTAGYSAVIAAIAQGSMSSTEEAKATTPEQIAQWYDFAARLRTAAASVNEGIHAGDAKATSAAMTRLARSCDDCHDVFHKEAKDAKTKDEDKDEK